MSEFTPEELNKIMSEYQTQANAIDEEVASSGVINAEQKEQVREW